MSRDGRACVGPCNRRWRDAWDAHDAAVDAWQDAMATYPAEHEEWTDLVAVVVATFGAFPLCGPACRSCDHRTCNAVRLVDWEPRHPGDRPAEPAEPFTLGDPIWCPRCAGQVRRALTGIDDLAALLDSWADGHRGASSGEKVSRRAADAGTPSPIAGQLDELYGELAAAEAGWRTRRGYAPRPRRARNGHARTQTIAWLLGQLDDIFLVRESADFGRRLLHWQRVLYRMTKSDPVVRKRPGRCPRCTWVNVLQTRDDDITECRNCGRLLGEEEYQRDVLGAAGEDVVAESRAS